MNQKMRGSLVLALFLCVGCPKTAVDVGDIPDGGGGGAGGRAGVGGGAGAMGGAVPLGGGGAIGGYAPVGGSTGAPGGAVPLGGGGAIGGYASVRGGAGPVGGAASSGDRTTFDVLQSPMREVDLLFMVDNSPSMDPKQAALATNFPKMMSVLQNLPGGLPDLHVGVISSDMGAGAGEAGGNCSVVLGNRGLLWGNDSSTDALAGLSSMYNQFATVAVANAAGATNSAGCGLTAGARWISDIQNADGATRTKNYTGNLTDVFSCLAQAVGVGGCGYEHQLQSIRVALNPIVGNPNDPSNPPINPQDVGFLRDKAYLAIVIISDEDDCSADPNAKINDEMFAPRTLGDTASLRCAARGHVCNGQAIPNYDPTNGYTGSGFSTSFANCAAKDQVNPSQPDAHWLPLISVEDMIDSVNQVKARPQEQILVSGIIGWPQNGDPTSVQYRIDKDTTSVPAQQQKLWDYMPICTVPSIKSADGNIYKAYGALRLKKFIDSYGDNGQTFSICNSDFTDAMTQTANAIAKKMKAGCVNDPLVDTNPDLPGIQPDCQATDRIPCDTPGKGGCLQTGYQETPISECIDPSTGNPLNPANPALNNIPNSEPNRPCWYLVYDMDPNTGCPDAVGHQRISTLRNDNLTAPAGTLLGLSCRTCQSSSDPRCTSH